MSYNYLDAYLAIAQTPKESYVGDFQAMLAEHFYESSDWYTILSETSIGSEIYANIDVRINAAIESRTGEKLGDDFKVLLFPNFDFEARPGTFFQFDNNYWIVTNSKMLKRVAPSCTVRRCNNSLRWMDIASGAIYQVPCVVGYGIKENNDFSTSQTALVSPTGFTDVFTQFNARTNLIEPSQRFLFGNVDNWGAFKIPGGGITNFNNWETLDNTTSGLLTLRAIVDSVNTDTDDLVNGIADIGQNTYVLTIDSGSSISGEVAETYQLRKTVTLNGATVTRSVVWDSTNDLIATVDSNGLVTFVSTGTCSVSCTLAENSNVSDSTTINVVGTPVSVYEIVLSPNDNIILETGEDDYSIYLHLNGVQQADAFTISVYDADVPAANYTFTVLGANSFRIKNVEKYFHNPLRINCVSGVNNRVFEFFLKGAW